MTSRRPHPHLRRRRRNRDPEQKGTEMKLIQILGLIAALGVGAAAQTTGAPDPAKSTKKSTDQKTTGNPAPGTTSTAKPAAGTAQTTPAAGKAKTTTGKIQINTVKTPPKKTVKTDVKTVPADG